MATEAGAPAAPAPAPLAWLEVFFDLVVVVSVAVLAERLHEHSGWGGLGVFIVVFTALWFTWLSFVVYTDIANESTRVAVLMGAAGMIALMTTTLPHLDERANAFAIGFVVCRVISVRASMSTGRILTSWPGAQFGGLTALWIISLWVDEPAKFWLWAVALTLQLVISAGQAAGSGNGEALVERVNARIRSRTRPGGRQVPELVATTINRDHLSDRLGTFLIIVLGEGVTEVVVAGSDGEWSRQLLLGTAAAFLILVGLWWLIFNHGLGDVGQRSARLHWVIPLHLFSAASLVLVAAALGVLLEDLGEPGPDFWRRLACGSLAVWFAIMSASAVVNGAPRRWIATRSAASAVAALVIGLAGADLAAGWVIALLLAAVAWTAYAPIPR